MALLVEYSEQERQEQLFRDYVGQCLWGIDTALRAQMGVDNDMPQYVEVAHPEQKFKDTRSAAEITQHILGELMG